METKTLGKKSKHSEQDVSSADAEPVSAAPVRKRRLLSIPNILIAVGILAVFSDPLIGDMFILTGLGISAYRNRKGFFLNA